jgi:hypothetical protein
MDCWQGSNAETRHFLSFPFLSFSASALPCRHLVFLLTSSFPCRSFLLITRFRWPLPTSLSRTHFSSSLLCGLRPGSLHHKNKNKASHLLSSPFRTFMLTTRIQPIEQPTSGSLPRRLLSSSVEVDVKAGPNINAGMQPSHPPAFGWRMRVMSGGSLCYKEPIRVQWIAPTQRPDTSFSLLSDP